MSPEEHSNPNADQTDTQRRAELWIREYHLEIQNSQQAILTQLQTLAENDILTDFTINTWGKYIEITHEQPAGTRTAALEKAIEFETWADQNGHDLQPGFRRYTHSSMLTETTREVIIPPILCLAIYEDDELHEVAPCSGPEGHQTLTACLESLAATNDESGYPG